MEELKLILEAVAQLGAQGKEAFIWWLVLEKGLNFVAIMSAIIGTCLIAKHIIRCLTYEQTLRDALGSMGIYSGWNISNYDLRRMFDWIESKK